MRIEVFTFFWDVWACSWKLKARSRRRTCQHWWAHSTKPYCDISKRTKMVKWTKILIYQYSLWISWENIIFTDGTSAILRIGTIMYMANLIRNRNPFRPFSTTGNICGMHELTSDQLQPIGSKWRVFRANNASHPALWTFRKRALSYHLNKWRKP